MATVVEVGDDRARNDEKRPVVEVSDETAHQISTDPWYQVGFVLTTGINSSYVLGYSGSIMVPLGWIGGVVGLLLAAAISLNANVLVARLHNVGGKRQIRYRDLAGHIYGRKMYRLTWALQYVNLFMINTGYIILAGQALKAIYVLYRDDGALKLPYCIAIAGFVCALFAFGIPHLSALRIWLGFSTFFSFVYIVIAFVLSLRDGNIHQIFICCHFYGLLGLWFLHFELPSQQRSWTSLGQDSRQHCILSPDSNCFTCEYILQTLDQHRDFQNPRQTASRLLCFPQPEISMNFITCFLTSSFGTVTVSIAAFTPSALVFSGSRKRRTKLRYCAQYNAGLLLLLPLRSPLILSMLPSSISTFTFSFFSPGRSACPAKAELSPERPDRVIRFPRFTINLLHPSPNLWPRSGLHGEISAFAWKETPKRTRSIYGCYRRRR